MAPPRRPRFPRRGRPESFGWVRLPTICSAPGCVAWETPEPGAPVEQLPVGTTHLLQVRHHLPPEPDVVAIAQRNTPFR